MKEHGILEYSESILAYTETINNSIKSLEIVVKEKCDKIHKHKAKQTQLKNANKSLIRNTSKYMHAHRSTNELFLYFKLGKSTILIENSS